MSQRLPSSRLAACSARATNSPASVSSDTLTRKDIWSSHVKGYKRKGHPLATGGPTRWSLPQLDERVRQQFENNGSTLIPISVSVKQFQNGVLQGAAQVPPPFVSNQQECLAMSEQPNVPADIYKAVERVLDEHSAWIARPSADVTESVARALMNVLTKRQRKLLVMDGAISAMEAINAESPRK
jgi:hypothetical protein